MKKNKFVYRYIRLFIDFILYILVALSIKQIDNRWRVDFFSTNDMQRLRRGQPFGQPGLSHKYYCKKSIL
jgi:hypothetical protein